MSRKGRPSKVKDNEDPLKNVAVSESVRILDHFKEYSDIVQQEINVMENYDVLNELPITLEELEKLQKNCDPSNLSVEYEIEPTSDCKKVTEAMRFPVTFKVPKNERIDLETLKCKERWKNHLGYSETFTVSFKKEEASPDLKIGEDIVVIVKMYNPSPFIGYSRRNLMLKSSHNVAILLNQTLANLRDRFICPCDVGFAREIEKPIETRTPLAKETYPSGFIFIENCFYNDMRHKNSFDYSEVIRNWADASISKDYKTAKMEETKLSDLSVRFGYPYVYQHQGNCEHIITFCDVRLLNNTDSLISSNYPHSCFHNMFQSRLCYICGKCIARFYVDGCEKLPYKYCYLCETCLTSYCYIDGEKIGNFKLYPYYDRSCNFFNL